MNNEEHYRHSLNNYLNTSTIIQSNQPSNYSNHSININEESFIPSIALLTNQMKYSMGRSLIEMELWIHFWLNQWINQPISSRRESDHFQMLSKFFEDYSLSALKYYRPSDSIGYSRYLLTSLSIISIMHEKLCQDQRFERFKSHRIDLCHFPDLFQYLILPY